MSRHVPFHRVALEQSDLDAVTATLRSGWLTSGPQVRELEAWLEERHGVTAVALASCSQALEATVSGLRLEKGQTVLTPSLTFTATSAAVVRGGGIPDWVDVDDATGLVTPEIVDAAIAEDTAAVLTVDYAGMPIDYAGLRRLCANRKLAFISDAAHSFGATVNGKAVGGLADATCLSFYATKNITGGEGGAILSSNPGWTDFARSWRLHGMTAGAEERYGGGTAIYDVQMLGAKANMTDITASLILSQGARDASLRTRRTAIAHQYMDAFAELEAVRLPLDRPGHAWHLFVIRLPAEHRHKFVSHLRSNGICTSIHFRPVHQMSYWRKWAPRRALPVTESWGASCVSLPLFPAMTAEDVNAVVRAVHLAVEEIS